MHVCSARRILAPIKHATLAAIALSTACGRKTPQQDLPAAAITSSAPSSAPGRVQTTKVPFDCEHVVFHRGWHFRGESTIVPSAAAELAAFHLTTRVSDGIA